MPPSSIAEGSPSQSHARLRSAIEDVSRSGIQYALMAYAFLLPFAKLSHVLEYAFLALLLVWVLLKASQKELPFRRTSLDVPILLFLAWVLFTTAFAVDPSYSFSEWWRTLPRVLMLYFVASTVSEERHVRNILVACVLGCFLQAVGALYSSLIVAPIPWNSIWDRESGWTSSSQWLSTYLIMMLPLFSLVFRSERRSFVRWAYVLGSILVFAALFFAHTRAAWVALIVQVLVLVSLRLKRSGVQASVVGAIALSLVILATAVPGSLRGALMQEPLTDTSSMMVRFNTWKLAIDQIAVRPITGLGYGRHSFQHVVPENPPVPLHTHIHNTFLSSAVQLGIPGFALLCWIFGRLLRECFRTWRANADSFEGQLALAVLLSAVGVVVRNVFDDMFVGTIVYQFWLLAGLHFGLSGKRAATGGAIRTAPRSASDGVRLS